MSDKRKKSGVASRKEEFDALDDSDTDTTYVPSSRDEVEYQKTMEQNASASSQPVGTGQRYQNRCKQKAKAQENEKIIATKNFMY